MGKSNDSKRTSYIQIVNNIHSAGTYKGLVEKLNYLTMTRPYISFLVSHWNTRMPIGQVMRMIEGVLVIVF
jgi:hypothetical protein